MRNSTATSSSSHYGYRGGVVSSRGRLLDSSLSSSATVASKRSAIPARRPLLIFNHNPKAGGGSILTILRDLKPNEVTVTNKGSTWEALDSVALEELKTAKLDANTTFVYVPENIGTRIPERQVGFVIGSVREPCSQYLSLWSFASTGSGAFAKYESKQDLKILYGQNAPLFDSPRDMQKFRQWVQHPKVVGVVKRRFLASYGLRQEGVDCWVYVESFQTSLVDCLEEYERQGGHVDWTVPSVAALVLEAKGTTSDHDENSYSAVTQKDPLKTKNDPLGNPQQYHHAACNKYFKPKLANRMEHGPEQFIYQAFGYNGCCSKSRGNRTSRSSSDDIAKSKTTISSTDTMQQLLDHLSIDVLIWIASILVVLLLLLLSCPLVKWMLCTRHKVKETRRRN